MQPRPHVSLWLAIVALLLIILAAGCAANKKPAPITAVGNAIARADAHTDSAAARVKEAIPHSNNTGKTLLDVAGKELTAAGSDHIEAAEQLERAAKDYQAEKSRADKAESFWGYWLGKAIQRFIAWIITAYLLFGALIVGAGVMAGPATSGLLVRLSVEPVRWLMVMAPFSYIRNFLRRRNGYAGL